MELDPKIDLVDDLLFVLTSFRVFKHDIVPLVPNLVEMMDVNRWPYLVLMIDRFLKKMILRGFRMCFQERVSVN